jgi:hypothetical protein
MKLLITKFPPASRYSLRCKYKYSPHYPLIRSRRLITAVSCIAPLQFLFSWFESPGGPRSPPCRVFEVTLSWHTALGRTPLDECYARRRDLYLTTNTHIGLTSMSPAGF